MLLADYPGPKGRCSFAGKTSPFFWYDTVELFATRWQANKRAPRRWVQDMGQADWNAPAGH